MGLITYLYWFYRGNWLPKYQKYGFDFTQKISKQKKQINVFFFYLTKFFNTIGGGGNLWIKCPIEFGAP